MNKLRNNRGETLVESLVSILIAVLAFGILATSVVTAEKINAQTRNTNVMFQYDTAIKIDDKDDKNVELKSTDKTQTGSGPVLFYKSNGYYYYSYDKAGAGS